MKAIVIIFLLIIVVVFMGYPLCAQQNPISYLRTIPGCSGGGTNTTSNTCNATLSSIPAAGGTYSDPDFSTNVLRVTQGGSCAGATTEQFSTQDAGWSPIFSVADDGILLFRQDGYVFWQPLTLTPNSMGLNGSCVELVPSAFRGSNVGAVMSRATSDVAYGFVGDKVEKVTLPSVTPVLVYDFTTIPGFTDTTLGLLYMDASDDWICASKAQESGSQVGCYNQSTGQTQSINLAAATEQQGSAAAVALDNLTSTQLSGCGPHEFIVSNDGSWMKIEAESNGTGSKCANQPGPLDGVIEIFWQMGTNHVTYEVYNPGGHQTMGYGSAYISGPGTPPNNDACNATWGMYIQALEFMYEFGNNLGTEAASHWSQLQACNPPSTAPQENHMSWLNNAGDPFENQYPLLIDQAQVTVSCSGYLCNEVDVVQTSPAYTLLQAGTYRTASNGTIWRMVNKHNDPSNSQCDTESTTASISPDGKFAAWTTNFNGLAGTGTCTNSQRTDVAIAQLLPTATSLSNATNGFVFGGTP